MVVAGVGGGGVAITWTCGAGDAETTVEGGDGGGGDVARARFDGGISGSCAVGAAVSVVSTGSDRLVPRVGGSVSVVVSSASRSGDDDREGGGEEEGLRGARWPMAFRDRECFPLVVERWCFFLALRRSRSSSSRDSSSLRRESSSSSRCRIIDTTFFNMSSTRSFLDKRAARFDFPLLYGGGEGNVRVGGDLADFANQETTILTC